MISNQWTMSHEEMKDITGKSNDCGPIEYFKQAQMSNNTQERKKKKT